MKWKYADWILDGVVIALVLLFAAIVIASAVALIRMAL